MNIPCNNNCVVSCPEIIGYMSVDVSREYLPDLSQLKFLNFIPPNQTINLNLNHGIKTAIKRTTDDNDENITLLLKFIMNNKEQNINFIDNIEQNFITYRRTLISVMCNAFNSEHIRIMACLFNKSIYLCSLETPLEKKKRLSRNQQDGRFCAWGYKFEQYMLADVPGVNPIIERPVVENEEFTLYYKTNLGDHTLLYGAQIDGLIATDGTVLPPPNTTDFQTNLNYLKQHTYVELKTNRIIQSKRQEQTFKKYKLLRCWCQCYLANLRGLLVGYRDDHGIVTSLNYYNTEDIPKYCKHERQPERC
ncbi:unnamed protein product [Chilo suppressalis]|uniref:Decapping nuclease n=1 Tax=Chilo suppressalis TaxID=168631 RepID=A0ABN8BCE3_CHISP|nr:unnamed protein product [Chilo suppressalis]